VGCTTDSLNPSSRLWLRFPGPLQLCWDLDLSKQKYRFLLKRYPGVEAMSRKRLGSVSGLSDFGFRLAKVDATIERESSAMSFGEVLRALSDPGLREKSHRLVRQSTFILRHADELARP